MGVIVKEIKAADTWDLRHRVMWPEKSIDYVKLEEDKNGLHFGLFKDELLVSVVSLFITGNEAQFRKFATDTKVQGNGYGTKLLQHLFLVAKQNKVETIWCNARVDKASFYKKSGMVETEQKFSKGGIDYVTMQKILN
ncbi:GNAT family N-acetyltransferase [Pedobacter cryoconitis]|uniref:Acetyltransferase (GNAT) family protein n=1 Tax=Pedobacter cryoconitis TaxID=188932 RepID=A0A327SVC6_9SPHI|nr:GNAT family N-acetyltransferase [Pedobacter cryoconitis]RAJ33326.1 acetyltransferase (GNAT) family protein [Pedobacter cryoconitis]